MVRSAVSTSSGRAVAAHEGNIMADGKWIEGLSPDEPLAQAAQAVLKARLEVVRLHLPLALAQADEDPEYVHQLRVGTRRSDAALRIFRDCLPRKTYRAARGRLRAIRRAAGAARDWDVFLDALRERLEGARAAERPGLDFLIGYSLGQRHAAQSSLAAVEQNQPDPFDQFMNETVGRVRPPREGEQTRLIDLARPMLQTLMRGLREKAAGDLSDYEHLHQVRIAGKRLRYAMEVFADCFGAGFREVAYPQVEQMQEILGRANDSHVAATRLSLLREKLGTYVATWERVRAGIESLLRSHQRRLAQERRRFVKWWASSPLKEGEGWLGG
jgi:CHAD domain-containing protein